MKIAFNGILLRNQNTGVENYIQCLLHEFDQSSDILNIDVKVFLKSELYGRDFLNLEKIYAQPFANYRAFRIAWEHFKLPQLCKDAELLHAPGYIMPINCTQKVIITVHDTIALTHPQLCSRMNAMYYRTFLPKSIMAADKIIVPSEFVKKTILSLFDIDYRKINVVEHGVKEIFFQEPTVQSLKTIKAKYNLPDEYILFVGTHEPKKNIRAVLSVYERLLNKYSKLGLVIVGQRGWRSQDTRLLLEKMKVKNTNLIETGFVPDEELVSIYKLAKVFLFPSLVEGFGLPLLEAMATGTPVVSTNVAAIPQVVGNCALLAKPQDMESLYKEAKKVLENKELYTTLAEKGKQHSKKFSWQKTARNTVSVYKSI